MPWTFSAASAIGGRDEQQDRLALFHAKGRDTHLLVLADGAGGHSNGAQAAQAVIDAAATCFTPEAEAEPGRLLVDICRVAHRRIRGLPSGGDRPPASTCVALLLRGRDAYWTHVGDSRLYLLRGERTLFQSEDHSLARLEADRPPGGGKPCRQIYWSLGASRDPSPEVESLRVEPGDRFLLCSDGLWNQLPVTRIARSLAHGELDEGAAQVWVEQAQYRGGACGDNISILIAECRPDAPRRGGRLWGWIARLFAPWQGRAPR